MTTWLPCIPLPSDWPAHAQLALLHAVALAHFGLTHIRGLGGAPTGASSAPVERAANDGGGVACGGAISPRRRARARARAW
jgi:hypothetical protein